MLGLSPDTLLLLIGVGMLTAVMATVARASHRSDPAPLTSNEDPGTSSQTSPAPDYLPRPRALVPEAPRPPWSR